MQAGNIMTRNVLVYGAIWTVIGLSATWGHAQNGYQNRYQGSGRYQSPSGPTVTPYLDYFRAPTGTLDTYNQYVRPRKLLTQTINQQEQQLDMLQERVNTVEKERGRTAIRSPSIGPTGNVPTRMNYSHYFGGAGGRR